MSEEFFDATKNLNPEIYDRFKRAVELGKWPDGARLSPEQREICMQAMINYELTNLPEGERTGYMTQQCSSKKQPQPEILVSSKD